MNDSNESVVPISLLATYDEMTRNNQVLLESSDAKLLEFVKSVERWRKKWENVELECERLTLELTRKEKEVTNLTVKLEHARELVDKEVTARKKIEVERDKLSDHLTLLRQLVMDDKLVGSVDQGTLRRIRELDSHLPSSYSAILSPGLVRERMYSGNNTYNMTEHSIRDVEDLMSDVEGDNTANLCEESRLRSGRVFHKAEKRKSDEYLSMDGRGAAAKRRRSRSVGFREPPVEEYVPKVPQPLGSSAPRGRSSSVGHQPSQPHEPPTAATAAAADACSATHTLKQMTVLKHETCAVCTKRIKFGKICLKCRGCKTVTHTECKDRIHPICEAATSTYSPSIVRRSPELYRTPETASSRKQIFASPMLR